MVSMLCFPLKVRIGESRYRGGDLGEVCGHLSVVVVWGVGGPVYVVTKEQIVRFRRKPCFASDNL
jgi:hypothetical protein